MRLAGFLQLKLRIELAELPSSVLLLRGGGAHASSDFNHCSLTPVQLLHLLTAQGWSKNPRGDGAATMTLQLIFRVGVGLFLQHSRNTVVNDESGERRKKNTFCIFTSVFTELFCFLLQFHVSVLLLSSVILCFIVSSSLLLLKTVKTSVDENRN